MLARYGKHPGGVVARAPKILARLAASKSGYIRITKIGVPDRTALAPLVDAGVVEVFESPLGRAYKIAEPYTTEDTLEGWHDDGNEDLQK